MFADKLERVDERAPSMLFSPRAATILHASSSIRLEIGLGPVCAIPNMLYLRVWRKREGRWTIAGRRLAVMLARLHCSRRSEALGSNSSRVAEDVARPDMEKAGQPLAPCTRRSARDC